MSSPIVSTFQSGSVGTSIARFVLPHAEGNAPVTYRVSPSRRGELQDQHVLGQPALVAGHDRGDPQGEALLAEQRVAAVARSRTTRSRGSRGSGRCTCSPRRTATARRPGPSASGTPTECRHGTNSPSSPRTSSAPSPIRVMIRMRHRHVGRVGDLDADVGDRPSRAGPSRRGRRTSSGPASHPRNSPVSVSRISAGSRQLLVGPASISSVEQMKVRSSTRATSPGSEWAQ